MEAIGSFKAAVGIRLDFGDSTEGPGHGYKDYFGPAYCDAVSRASRGEKLRITAGSINRCLWAPVVLGLKESESSFEKSLGPRLEALEAIYAFPLGKEGAGHIQPDLVIIRNKPDIIKRALEQLADGRLEGAYMRRFDMSALAVIDGKRAGPRAGAVKVCNRLVCRLKRYGRVRQVAEVALQSPAACYLLDKIIALFLANMSVCRNSTVIPALKERANCSHFCSGAIFWGGNDPASMVAGIPYDLFCRLERRL